MKTRIYGLACLGLMALSPMLISCDDDDEDKAEILLPIAGDFTGTESCPPSPASGDYQVHVYNSANDPNTIWIENFYDIGVKVKANYDGGNSFTIPSQSFTVVLGKDTLSSSVSGNGSVDGKKITINFNLTDDLEDACTFTGEKEVLQTPVGQ